MGDRSPSPATSESRKRQIVEGGDGQDWGNGTDAVGGRNEGAGGELAGQTDQSPGGGIRSEDRKGAVTNRGGGAHDGRDGRLEPACAIKMLVPSVWAGCLIGKGGSTINELQERTGARIKLSQSNDFYPGTQERIVLITGDTDIVRHALALVIEHLHVHGPSRGANPGVPMDPTSTTQVKLLIATGAGGLLIGRGGATIKTLNEECGARIQLAAKDDAGGVVTGERVVTISGPLDGVLKGINRILEKLSEEPELARYQNLTTSYSRSTSAAHPMHPAFDIPTYHTQSFGETQQIFSPGSASGPPPPRGPPPPPQAMMPSPPGPPQGAGQVGMSAPLSQIKIQVPDRLIGAVLGKGGAVLRDLQQQSGARITISKRGEYAPGTTNRIVTIEGSAYSAETARSLVSLKVQQGQMQPGPGLY